MADTTNTAEILITADSSGVEAGLRQATTAAERAERQMSGGANNSARSQSNLISAIQRTTAQMEAGSRTGSRYFEIMARQRGVDPAVLEPYLRQLRAVEEAQRRAAESAGDSSNRIESAFAALRGGAIVAALAALTAPVVGAQREFDKLNASLITATGSADKAVVAFTALQSFAATTPYGVAEATEAFIKMRNMGLDPSERALRSYGNTAAAMGKSLEQMVEAVADAATGEFERLKEFGIKASQNGEKLTLTFKGASTTIKNDAEAIEKYLMKIGEVDFAGAMVQRAATLDGAISQLADSWDSAMRTISASGIGQAAQDGVIGLSASLSDLETILLAISEAADKQAEKLSAASTIHKALTTVFEAVSVLGVNVAYVFRQVGNELGGLAAQATAVATGNFTQARIIGEQMKADAQRDRLEVDRQTAAILGAVEKAKKAAENAPKRAPGEDALAQFRIQREAERESDAAAKRRAEQIKRETAALAELAGLTSSFAEEWKMLSKLYGDGKINLETLTKAQAELLAKQPAMKAARESEARALKQVADFEKAYAEALSMTSDILAGRIKDAKSEAEKNEELARTYGMSAAAIAQEEVARLKNQLARASEEGLQLDEIEYLKEIIALRERSAAALSSVETRDANAKAAEKAAQEWERSAEQIGQSLTDNIMRGGKSAAEYLRDLFRTLVLKPIIQPIGNAVGNFVNGAMGMPGAAQAAGGGLSAATGAASNLYGMFTGGATMAGGLGTGFLGSLAGGLNGAGIGSGLTSALGMNIGNSIASVVGPNVASGIASGLSGLAAAAPWVAGALAVYTIGKKAFGRGPKEFTGEQTLNGSLGAGGFTGTLDAEWVKKGGWFRSSKIGYDPLAVGAEMSAGLTSAYDAIKAASADFASVLGINADSIKDRTQALSIAMGKDEAANQKAIADFFVGVGNTIAGELLPSLSQFQQEGEQASATLQRLATGYALVDTALTSIGMSFGAVGTASLEARERLLAAAGGLEAFAANTAGFQQNFLSESERNAPVLKMVTEQMAALGLASVDTRDEFKQVVLGLDLTTEAGAKQYGALMNLQAAFAQVYPAIDKAAIAAQVLQQRMSLQEELDQLTMTSAQMLAKQRDALDENNRPLFDQIQALKESRAALEAQAEAQRNATQAAQDRGANLLSGVDSMFSALQSVVGREKSLLEQSANAHRALSSALRSTLDSMSVAGRELEDRQSARAQVQAALAIAKAGGVLPDADSLKGALSVLSKDASSMFATQQDYLRDFYSTQNDIAALAGLTDDALSVEEKSLKALDGILESAQQQINALKGIDYSVLTLAQAISGFDRALGAAKADPVASAGGSIAKLYQELLGRPADSAGLDYWQNAVAGGLSLDQVRKMIMESSEYKGIPGFASGGMFGGGLRIVGENGPELEATGPSRIWSASQTAALLSRAGGDSGGAAMAAELKALREEVKGLRAEARATAGHTEKTSRLLNRVIRGDKLNVGTEEEQ